MSTYVREQRVEAKQWQPSDIARYAEMWAYRVVDWVNDNGGEAHYRREGVCREGWLAHEDGCPDNPAARIAIRTVDGWAYAAPGDYIEMGTTVFHPHDGSSCSDNPLAGSCSNRVRNFIVRNAAYFSGWRVTS